MPGRQIMEAQEYTFCETACNSGSSDSNLDELCVATSLLEYSNSAGMSDQTIEEMRMHLKKTMADDVVDKMDGVTLKMAYARSFDSSSSVSQKVKLFRSDNIAPKPTVAEDERYNSWVKSARNPSFSKKAGKHKLPTQPSIEAAHKLRELQTNDSKAWLPQSGYDQHIQAELSKLKGPKHIQFYKQYIRVRDKACAVPRHVVYSLLYVNNANCNPVATQYMGSLTNKERKTLNKKIVKAVQASP